MRKYFVWTHDLERVIYETLSGKRKRLALNSDSTVKLFSRAAEASEHYYSFTATMYTLSKRLKKPNMSSVFRKLERNEHLWEGAGLIFSAIELQKVLAAPPGSIITPTFDIGGYGFEITKPTDPDYLETYSRLPGAA
jgi:hypothetical protein